MPRSPLPARLSLLVPALGVLAACGGGEADPLTLAGFLARENAAQCDFLRRCSWPVSLALHEDWRGPCESWATQDAGLEALWVAAEAEGTIVFSAPDAQACLDVLEGRAACAGHDACLRVMAGTVAQGGACTGDETCVEGTHCVTAACPGTCVADKAADAPCALDSECRSGLCGEGGCLPEPRPDGASCADHGECASLWCLDRVCTARVEEDGGCTKEADCGPYLWCDPDADRRAGFPGLCRPVETAFVLGAGEACAPGREPYCRPGLTCMQLADAAAHACAAPVESGAACRPALPEPCPTGEYCDLDAGRCRPRPGHGEACGGSAVSFAAEGRTLHWTCAAGHYCVRGVCRRQGLPGEACDGDDACWYGACEAGTCTALACQPDWS